MNENGGKSNTVLLAVIGIATLLVVVVGATFAYFAAQVNGEDTSVLNITASDKGTEIEASGLEEVTVANVYPRPEPWVEKVISLKTSNYAQGTSSTATYTFSMVVASNFVENDLQYTFIKQSGPTDATETAELTNLASNTDIAHGTVSLTAPGTITYLLQVYFVNKENVNQNPAVGATTDAQVEAANKTARFHVDYTYLPNNNTQG